MTVALKEPGLEQVRHRHVPMDAIRIDGGTQPRAAIAEDVVSEYAEAMKEGAEFPPAVLFHDGVDYWLADGFHRFFAARVAGFANFLSDVRTGTRREAVLFSVGANTAHGMRRSNADKRKAVETLLSDPEWALWSDREIARRCGVHHDLVAQLRPVSLAESASERTYTTKHGTEATMSVATINAGRAEKASVPREERRAAVEAALKADPMAASAVIAARVGCSDALVSEVRTELDLPAVRLFRPQGFEERARRFGQAMDSLQGFVLGFNGLPLDELAEDPRASRWVEQITELIVALRKVRGGLTGDPK